MSSLRKPANNLFYLSVIVPFLHLNYLNHIIASLAIAACASTAAAVPSAAPDSLYHELYRPQYHFTPAHRWIGDPCGLVKYRGRYYSYSWGGAESSDLVHWTETSQHAIKGLPAGISAFTGSVVVDTAGTAGYGPGAMIAAFTGFHEDSKKQEQSIAFSVDSGRSYQYYDLNPVIDTWSTEFRDPTVIPDPEHRQWVMFVAKALEKKVAIYGSPDLKHWNHLSDFGPLGDSERSWECPDIFRIPVENRHGRFKWVMVLSINWARQQYFVGEFDGTRFIPDHPERYPLYLDQGLDYYAARVFQDYDRHDGPVHTLAWVNTWDYAQHAPTTYGKGIWSIPREYRLVSTPEGYRLRQLPARALESLRGKPYTATLALKPGATPIPAVSRMDNTYELHATFSNLGTSTVGLNLFQGDGRALVLTYNPVSRRLILDRTNTTPEDIPHFPRITSALISQPEVSQQSAPHDATADIQVFNPRTARAIPASASRKAVNGTDPADTLTLTVFVDKSLVEIFVNDGSTVLTALTFAAPSQTGISAFAIPQPEAKTAHPSLSLTAYPLASIH